VSAPFGPSAAQIDAARSLGADRGIGTLVIAHGSNNALRSVVDKRVAWSDTGYDTLDGKAGFTVWRPTHFALEYGRLEFSQMISGTESGEASANDDDVHDRISTFIRR